MSVVGSGSVSVADSGSEAEPESEYSEQLMLLSSVAEDSL